MRIYIPFIGVEMPSTRMTDYGRSLGINVDIQHVGRPKIRNAAPGVAGKPHQEYKVRLFPISEEYRKLREHEIYYPAGQTYTRRINAVCWHGHKNFMVRLFTDFDDATIRAGLIPANGIEYRGVTDFFDKYAATKALFYRYGAKCLCTDLKLATWESESHLPS